MRRRPRGLRAKINRYLRQSKHRKKKYYNLENRQKKMRRRETMKNIRSNMNVKDWVIGGLKKVPAVLVLLLCVGLALLAAKALVGGYGQRISVVGDSMNPILSNGDVCLLDSDVGTIRRGDIIAFQSKSDDTHYYVKRVIALPGETITILENTIFIDGEKLTESYEVTDIDDPGLASKKIELGEDEYFVLGDDRENSEDSRDAKIGKVKKEKICGKPWFVVSPRADFGFVK